MNKQTEVQVTQTPVFKSVRPQQDIEKLSAMTTFELESLQQEMIRNMPIHDHVRLRADGPNEDEVSRSFKHLRLKQIHDVLTDRRNAPLLDYGGII